MKKIFGILFLVVLLWCTLVSCLSKNNQESGNTDIEQHTEQTTLDITTNADDHNEPFDYEAFFMEYNSNKVEIDDFKYAFNNSEKRDYLPVLGTYLQETKYVLCLFYDRNTLLSAFKIGVSSNATDFEGNCDMELFFENSLYYISYYQTELSCLKKINSCKNDHPDYQIMGVVYSDIGYGGVYPIGLNKGDDHLTYYLGELNDFRLVEPFNTIEEGRIKFENYLSKREEIKSGVPIFLWHNYDVPYNGYSSEFLYNDVQYEDNGEDYYFLIQNYDSQIDVPLLNKYDEEGTIVLSLFYYRNNLIGEIVLESNKSSESTRLVNVLFSRLAKMNSNELITPLERSKYEELFDGMSKETISQGIIGVKYDNGYAIVWNEEYNQKNSQLLGD